MRKMAYVGPDGMLRGKRGGLSSKNSREAWAKYYGPPLKKLPTVPVPPAGLHKHNAIEYMELQEIEHLLDERDYFVSRGYDPDDPGALDQMALDAEDEGYY